ncbi:uncharacterized protein BDR25DRAFT_129275 [Lindgomyces ingoldianus]|uniref:Uncharacterized protein n=1 Tax=Lindgomyces ingoldianus TaxID=673940 RepID=A0ACB6R4C9_9PLEO|nr:uncharacterized protein BDR25DRAFT_129275 [Lindgomyces ingoldianus]KAF2473165.1 hypothetical protein BDR25DRAFT_129275 [Lindgomyces ingoldianus]
MARDRDERNSRYYYDDYSSDDRDRERRSHRHRHRRREYDDEDSAAKRERRERRRAEEARRDTELDLDELRARRASFYSRPEPERRRESQRMAQEIRIDREKTKPRSSHREVRRDGTRRKKRQEKVGDDRSDDYVYGRPKSRGLVEEIAVKRSSARRRSDEGGSLRRAADSPRSGSGSRPVSVRRVEVPKLSRSVSAREPNRVYMATRPSMRRSSTLKLPTATATPISRSHSMSARDSARDSTHAPRRSTGGLLATLFKPPTRASTTVLHKEIPRVQCLVCLNDDLLANKTAKLSCGHRMCHSCLKRQFSLSVTDPQHMPPTCCNAEHIPLKHVERLFDDKFKKLWNKKYQEYTTANRLYCPTKGCGEWIKPSKIRMDLATSRKYARCGRCSTKVCVLCNNRFHTRRECPRDEETSRFVQMAKDKGWQRCYNCKAMVELKEGCNHMTCRCTAQFCMICALPWKTCNCPWFNYNHLNDDDRLNDMRVPYIPQQDVVEVVELPPEPAPHPARRASTRLRHRVDRDLERADEALAAHLQAQLILNNTPTHSETRRSDPNVQVYGVGNSGTHHMNDSYTVRPLATAAARTSVRMSTPRFFSRRVVRESVRSSPAAADVRASTMAGLSRDGTRRGANRVGTWLQHVQLDREAVDSAPRGVEVDDWRADGSMMGID